MRGMCHSGVITHIYIYLHAHRETVSERESEWDRNTIYYNMCSIYIYIRMCVCVQLTITSEKNNKRSHCPNGTTGARILMVGGGGALCWLLFYKCVCIYCVPTTHTCIVYNIICHCTATTRAVLYQLKRNIMELNNNINKNNKITVRNEKTTRLNIVILFGWQETHCWYILSASILWVWEKGPTFVFCFHFMRDSYYFILLYMRCTYKLIIIVNMYMVMYIVIVILLIIVVAVCRVIILLFNDI